MEETIFQKIIKGEIPSTKIYEDEKVYCILDINPNNLGHTLVISKEVYKDIHDTPDEIMAHMMIVAKKLATAIKNGLGVDGVNIRMNNGEAAGQEIDHVHMHVIPRLVGDGGFGTHVKYKNDAEMAEYAEKIKAAF